MQWFKSLFQTFSNEFDANSNCLLLRMNNGCVLYLWHPRKSDMHPQPSRLSFPLAPSLPITTVPIPAQVSADKQCTFCQWSWPWWSSSSSDLSGQANVLSANVVIQVCKHWHTLIKRPLQTFPFHLHLGSLYLFPNSFLFVLQTQTHWSLFCNQKTKNKKWYLSTDLPLSS